MNFKATTLLQLILALLWLILSTTPTTSVSAIFPKILPSAEVVTDVFNSAAPVFAPGVYEVLQAATPPTVAFFASLPTDFKDKWAIYALTLEKPGFRPKIYIGSGTRIKVRVLKRLLSYDRGECLPHLVAKALEDDYVIVHKGLLCWIPIPSAVMAPLYRLLFVALEALFTFVFWAINCKTEYGYGMTHLCPWNRNTLEYDGLCTHHPLSECPRGEFLTEQEIEAKAREALAKQAAAVREWRAKAKAQDPVKYKQQKHTWYLTSERNNPGGSIDHNHRSRARAVAEKRHYCSVCDYAAMTTSKLRDHLKSAKHAAKVAAVKAGKVNVLLEQEKKKRWFCASCGIGFNKSSSWKRHLASPRHKKKAAAAPKDAVLKDATQEPILVDDTEQDDSEWDNSQEDSSDDDSS